MPSIQSRLRLGLLITIITLFGLQWVVVTLSIRYLTEGYIAARLEDDAQTLLAALSFNKDGIPVLDADTTHFLYNRVFSGRYYRIESTPNVLRSRSLWDYELRLPKLVEPHQRLHVEGPEQQPLLVLTNSYQKQGQHILIVTAEDIRPVLADIRVFQWRYALVTLAVLAILILFQSIIVRRSLRPIDAARQELARLQQGVLSRLNEQAPREILPLIREINRLIEAMEKRLQRSRNALGNLTHALKTPLAVLMQLAEAKEIRQHTELHHDFTQQLNVLLNLVERELKRARLAGRSEIGKRFEIEREVLPLITIMQAIYREKRLRIHCTIPPQLSFPADREDMLELFGNLLDNAWKWSVGEVLLTVENVPYLVFHLEDNGPGCSDEQLTKLTQRGMRIDETTAGYGLGLAIAKDIVDDYGGKIEFGRSATLGGFKVSVQIPTKEA